MLLVAVTRPAVFTAANQPLQVGGLLAIGIILWTLILAVRAGREGALQ
ncbi:MAG: hypothetical protein ACI8S6_001167 [Myxococcota bacterium]